MRRWSRTRCAAWFATPWRGSASEGPRARASFLHHLRDPSSRRRDPHSLRERFPAEMTIVLQHQYWDLEVRDDAFSVTLSFQKQLERLTIPLAAIRGFADPSVNFALEFAAPDGEAAAAKPSRRPRRSPAPPTTAAAPTSRTANRKRQSRARPAKSSRSTASASGSLPDRWHSGAPRRVNPEPRHTAVSRLNRHRSDNVYCRVHGVPGSPLSRRPATTIKPISFA